MRDAALILLSADAYGAAARCVDMSVEYAKNREQFGHYLDNDTGHCRSGWDRRIDLQALEEIPQALEEVEYGIVTRRNPTGSLAYSYIRKELFEENTHGTYSKEDIDPNKQSICWREGDLTRSHLKTH